MGVENVDKLTNAINIIKLTVEKNLTLNGTQKIQFESTIKNLQELDNNLDKGGDNLAEELLKCKRKLDASQDKTKAINELLGDIFEPEKFLTLTDAKNISIKLLGKDINDKIIKNLPQADNIYHTILKNIRAGTGGYMERSKIEKEQKASIIYNIALGTGTDGFKRALDIVADVDKSLKNIIMKLSPVGIGDGPESTTSTTESTIYAPFPTKVTTPRDNEEKELETLPDKTQIRWRGKTYTYRYKLNSDMTKRIEHTLTDTEGHQYIAPKTGAPLKYQQKNYGREEFRYNEEHPEFSIQTLHLPEKDKKIIQTDGLSLNISVFGQDLSGTPPKQLGTITMTIGGETVKIINGYTLSLEKEIAGITLENNILHINQNKLLDKQGNIKINNISITSTATTYEGNGHDENCITIMPNAGYICENDSGHDKDGKALGETEISEQKQRNFTDIMNRMQIAMKKFPDDNITVNLGTGVCETRMKKATIEENRKKREEMVNSLSGDKRAQELFQKIDETGTLEAPSPFDAAFGFKSQEAADQKLLAKARLVELGNLEYNGKTFRELLNSDKITIILDTTVGPEDTKSRGVSFGREFTSND